MSERLNLIRSNLEAKSKRYQFNGIILLLYLLFTILRIQIYIFQFIFVSSMWFSLKENMIRVTMVFMNLVYRKRSVLAYDLKQVYKIFYLAMGIILDSESYLMDPKVALW
jgi:hypothetical protein